MPAGLKTPMTMKRIHREINDLKKEDLGNIVLEPTDNLQVWRGVIPGPEGSVYEGGVFQVEIALPNDYPFTAPNVVFKTRIYHMNISEQGGICIDILKNNWSPALSLFKVMLSLSSLLTDPNPKDPLVPGIATQYVRNRKLHDATARQWTGLYAQPSETKRNPVPDSDSIMITSTTPTMLSSQDHRNQISSRLRANRHRADPVAGPSTPALRSSSTSNATDEVIVLDSDEERLSSSTAKKRKRETVHVSDVAKQILDLTDSGNESGRNTARRKITSSRTSNDDSSQNSRRSSEVIVIDD